MGFVLRAVLILLVVWIAATPACACQSYTRPFDTVTVALSKADSKSGAVILRPDLADKVIELAPYNDLDLAYHRGYEFQHRPRITRIELVQAIDWRTAYFAAASWAFRDMLEEWQGYSSWQRYFYGEKFPPFYSVSFAAAHWVFRDIPVPWPNYVFSGDLPTFFSTRMQLASYRFKVMRTLSGAERANFVFGPIQNLPPSGISYWFFRPPNPTLEIQQIEYKEENWRQYRLMKGRLANEADDPQDMEKQLTYRMVSRSSIYECSIIYSFRLNVPAVFYWRGEELVAVGHITPEAVAYLMR